MTQHSYSRNDDEFDHEDVLERSRKFAQHMGMKDATWFGFSLDKDMRNIVSPLWVGANAFAKGKYEHHITDLAAKALDTGILKDGSALRKIPLLKKALSNPKYLAAAFFSVLLASPTLPALISPVTNWRKERKQMAQDAAPILKDMAAEGMPGSIGGVGIEDNEVIYAHRKRINTNLSHVTVNNVLQTASSQIGMIIKGEKPTKGHAVDAGLSAKAGDAAGLLLAIPPAVDALVGRFTDSRNKELAANRGSCSAFQLITNLDEQIKKRAKNGDGITGGDFAFPKTMGNRSAGLADYIATTIKAHSEEMERLLPNDYSQLRDALKPQIKEVSKVLAEAITSGELAPLSLIRLIGEGKIIKQQGRTLVDVEELKHQINKHAGTQAGKAEIDPKEYLKMATFKDKELKETLASLEGNERAIFASFFPDTILKKTGMSEAEIETIRKDTAPMYENNLANLLAGIANQPDADLKSQGLADREIKTIKDAAKTLQERGAEAVHALRANATNPIGIELPLLNAAMAKISEPHYVGKMLSQGSQLLTEGAKEHAAIPEGEGGEGHRARPRHNHEAAEHHERAEPGKHTRAHRERSEHGESHGTHRA